MKKVFDQRVIFVAPLGGGHAVNATGDVVKNRFLLNEIREYFGKVLVFNTQDYKKHLFRIFALLVCLVLPVKCDVIISIHPLSAYKLLRFCQYFTCRKRIYYFVIGGDLPGMIEANNFDVQCFRKLERIFCESDIMCSNLQKLGIDTSVRCQNFKDFNLSSVAFDRKDEHSPIRFLYLGRIAEEKGISFILRVLQSVNSELGKQGRTLEFDLYGSVSDDFKSVFESELKKYAFAQHKGVLDMSLAENYQILRSYHAMLFPTCHANEGFPGVIIDAAIAGLPVIANHWRYAVELITVPGTGIVLRRGDSAQWLETIMDIIHSPEKLHKMQVNSVAVAPSYHVKNILSGEFFIKYFSS